MRCGEEVVEDGEVTEERFDVGVVGDVVAEVRHGRWVDRRQPQAIHAEPLEVVQLRRDAVEVTNAIPVRVEEGSWVDLVDNGLMPPRGHGSTLQRGLSAFSPR